MHDTVTKREFLKGLTCPTLGWFEHNATPSPPSAGDEWRFHFGGEIGRLARSVLGAGRLLPVVPTATAVASSAEALRDAATTLVFEVTFVSSSFVARADALRRHANGWDVIEVKSGKSPDGDAINRDYVADLAFTVFVAQQSGLRVARAILLLVNRDYRLGADAPMFVEQDVTDDVLAFVAVFAAAAPNVAAQTLSPEKPAPTLIFACKECTHFDTDCVGVGIDDHLFVLPRLLEKRFGELRQHERIANLPAGTKLSDGQRRIAGVIRSGQPIVERDGLRILDDVVWPAFYLDFEAVMPPLPWFPSAVPYEAVPFQYALDVCAGPDAEPDHFEYLAPIDGDWRRELIETLLHQLGSTGSIIVYSSYEKTRLNALAKVFPDLSSRIEGAVARLFDLERVFKNGYCHPGFGGRTSIKKVLPVMVPDLSYQSLAIGNGEDAMAIFSLMRVKKYSADTHAAHRENLLRYCGLDTRAMVRLHRAVLALPT